MVGVAQWQSTGLWLRLSRVRSPSLTLKTEKTEKSAESAPGLCDAAQKNFRELGDDALERLGRGDPFGVTRAIEFIRLALRAEADGRLVWFDPVELAQNRRPA